MRPCHVNDLRRWVDSAHQRQKITTTRRALFPRITGTIVWTPHLVMTEMMVCENMLPSLFLVNLCTSYCRNDSYLKKEVKNWHSVERQLTDTEVWLINRGIFSLAAFDFYLESQNRQSNCSILQSILCHVLFNTSLRCNCGSTFGLRWRRHLNRYFCNELPLQNEWHHPTRIYCGTVAGCWVKAKIRAGFIWSVSVPSLHEHKDKPKPDMTLRRF